MHPIYFYRNKNGKEPVLEYLQNLSMKSDKDSRIKANKIQDYIEALSKMGTHSGLPYVKHIEDDLWELRPLRDRIFFVTWHEGSFVLLHHFMKKTQKTPLREIEKARKEIADLRERGVSHEK